MNTGPLPAGPERRAAMVAAGTNVTLADYNEAELAELDEHAEVAMDTLRRHPDSPFFDAEAGER